MIQTFENGEERALLYVADIQQRYGISRRTLRRLAYNNRGTFPKPRQLGGRLAWRRDELDAYLLDRNVVEEWPYSAA